MAIKTSIVVNDRMSPALKSMNRALSIMLNSFESVQKASGKAINTQNLKIAKQEIANANMVLNQTEQELKKINNEANKTPSKFSLINNTLDTTRSKMEKTAISASTFAKGILGAAVIQKVLGMITNQLDSAIERFDTINNYPKVLQNLGFSGDIADKSISRLQEGLKGLPTKLNDAISGVQRFVATNGNVKASTEMWLAMNDAILAGGGNTATREAAIEQLTQAYSKGKPEMQEWKSLQQAMPGQLKQIAIAMGYVSSSELYDALQKGNISMNDFMETIVRLDREGIDGFADFHKQATDATNGIGTAMENLKAAIDRGWVAMIDNANSALEASGLPTIQEMIKNIGDGLEDLMTKIGQDLIPTLAKEFNEMSNVFKDFSKNAENSAMSSLTAWDFFMIGIKTVGLGVDVVFNGLKVGILTLKLFMQEVCTAIVGAWNGLYTGIQAVIFLILKAVDTMINGILAPINGLINGINNVFGGFGVHIDNLKSDMSGAYGQHMLEGINERNQNLANMKQEAKNTAYQIKDISTNSVSRWNDKATAIQNDIIDRANKNQKEAEKAKEEGERADPSNWGELNNNVAAATDNTGKISDTLDATAEDLKYIRDLAERDVINRFTTAEIKLDFTSNNNITSNMDLDGVLEGIKETIYEAVISGAEEVHA